MKDQLKLLEELQRHDSRLQELDGMYKALPAKLQVAEATIAELEKLIQKERAELADTESFQKELERAQKDTESQLQKGRGKLNAIRNSKEAEAVQREIESARKSIESRTEEMAKLAQVLVEQRKKITEHEERLLEERKELAAQQSVVQEKMKGLEGDLSAARGTREEVAKTLKADALRKYNNIMQRRRGSAVVAVKDGTCRGCNMNIPPQLYNILQRGTTLELCPNCNRIIYWDKLLAEPS